MNAKGKLIMFAWCLGICVFIGGCSAIDYQVFRAKWPERSIWIWLWSGSKG